MRLTLPFPVRRSRAGFTLIEMLVVIAIIGILASLLLPAFAQAKERARVAKCLSNLKQIGFAIQTYVLDNDNRMPVLFDRPVGMPPVGNSMDVVLLKHAGNNVQVFKCPSDRERTFELTGSSYSWNVFINGQPADALKVLNLSLSDTEIPIFFDKDKFHTPLGDDKDVNYLYADGNIKNQLVIGGSILPRP